MDRLDAFQRRHPVVGMPLAVVYKYFDDQGPYLAATLTYYTFIAIFPMMLIASSVLGFILQGNEELQQQLLDSAMRELPVIGPQLGTPEQLGGGIGGLVVGIAVALYGGMGLGQSLQYAMNTAWSVPRARRPDVITSRGRSLLLLGTFYLLVLTTSAISAFAAGAAVSGEGLGVVLNVLVVVGSIVVNAGIFVLAFRLTTARKLTVRQVAPGAVVAAVAWQLLQSFGGIYVAQVVEKAGTVNAVFALVLGLMAFIYLAAVVLVLCVEIDVVRVDHLYPRALLTPFVDHKDLTEGDERVYADAARAQQAVKHQEVDVRFDPGDGGAEPPVEQVERPREEA